MKRGIVGIGTLLLVALIACEANVAEHMKHCEAYEG
jgi:hypothetical protein